MDPRHMDQMRRKVDTILDRMIPRLKQLNSDTSTVYSKIRAAQRGAEMLQQAVRIADYAAAYVVLDDTIVPAIKWLATSALRLDPEFKQYNRAMGLIQTDLSKLKQESRWLVDYAGGMVRAVRRAVVATLIKAGRRDLALVVAKPDLRAKVIEFFKQNPNPPDSKVHELAESLGVDPHKLESVIYSLLSEYIKEST